MTTSRRQFLKSVVPFMLALSLAPEKVVCDLITEAKPNENLWNANSNVLQDILDAKESIKRATGIYPNTIYFNPDIIHLSPKIYKSFLIDKYNVCGTKINEEMKNVNIAEIRKTV